MSNDRLKYYHFHSNQHHLPFFSPKKKSLPSLNELIWLPGNEGLSSGGDQFHYIALFHCKRLTKINEDPTEERKTGLNSLRSSLLQIVTEVWPKLIKTATPSKPVERAS